MPGLTIAGLAARNLWRNPVRSVILMLLTAVVTGTILATIILSLGMKNALISGSQRLGADVLIIPEGSEVIMGSSLLSGEPSALTMPYEVLVKTRAIEGVRHASPQLFIKPTPFSCCYNVDVFLVAIDPSTDFSVIPWTGRKPGSPLTGNHVITGSDIPAGKGDAIPFFGTPFTIASKMEATGIPFFDRSIFMSMDAAYAMAENSGTRAEKSLTLEKGRISAILVQTEGRTTPEKVAIRIEYELPGVKAIPSNEILTAVRRQMGRVGTVLISAATAIWLLTLLVLGFAFSMIVNERQREMGLLRAMGAKKKELLRLVITEATVISSLGGIAGVISASVLLAFFHSFIAEDLSLAYLFPSGGMWAASIIGSLFLSWLTCLLASSLPAVSATRTDLHAAIHNEPYR